MAFTARVVRQGGAVFASLLGFGGALPAQDIDLGPLWADFKLTLEEGRRTEWIGPVFHREEQETVKAWAVSPLMSALWDDVTDYEKFHLLYPLLTYQRFGSQYRWQLGQVLSFAGGQNMAEDDQHRFTLFPLYFQQRSSDPELNYTALFPIYGTLKNRLFRDETQWFLWPLYVKTQRRAFSAHVELAETLDGPVPLSSRQKSDITTYNYLVPFFHLRYGDGLKGWQFWPLVGHEHKDVTYRTNIWAEIERIGGHDKFFALWPLYFNHHTDLGTTNAGHQLAVLPFYTALRSPMRDSTAYGWPFGFTYTDDRARQYREWDLFWPLIVFARGAGKTGNRVLPFFSEMRSPDQTRRLYGWPLYRYAGIHTAALDRRRHRILYFLYSDLSEKNLATQQTLRRVDAWPLWTWRRDFEGKTRLQILAPLEPLLPRNEGVERNYAPLWSLWRAEKNPPTGAASQSLLWNLYRRETVPGAKKCSLLFGLFQYQSGPDETRWRLFYIPMVKTKKAPAAR